jgi:hypothetical protein
VHCGVDHPLGRLEVAVVVDADLGDDVVGCPSPTGDLEAHF